MLESRKKSLFFEVLTAALTVYMRRFKSIKLFKAIQSIRAVIENFELKLGEVRSSPYISKETLTEKKLFKAKYYVYAAYLAALSSYPILHKASDEKNIHSSIFSKTAMVASIKLLDNINDNHQRKTDDAVESQKRYFSALTTGRFPLNSNENSGWVDESVNTANLIASWAYELIALGRVNSKMFNIFVNDVNEYINGQIASFSQKKDEFSAENMTLTDFLKKVSAKCFGKIWVDIDFCFLEKAAGELDEKEMKAIGLVNKSLDLTFKSLLFYDDVTDFDEDSENGIINSTMMLGIELGKISVNEIYENKKSLYEKLRKKGVFNDAIAFGNILYLKGAEYLIEAKKYSRLIDMDALIFCTRILRLFLLRKTLQEMNPKNLRIILQSLESFDKLKKSIPQYLKCYEKLVEEMEQRKEANISNFANDEHALLIS